MDVPDRHLHRHLAVVHRPTNYRRPAMPRVESIPSIWIAELPCIQLLVATCRSVKAKGDWLHDSGENDVSATLVLLRSCQFNSRRKKAYSIKLVTWEVYALIRLLEAAEPNCIDYDVRISLLLERAR
jgi:hypothetical protein